MPDKIDRTPGPDAPPLRPADPRREAGWVLQQVEDALRGLRFGQVTITVQDGVVVQVERVERRRFQK